MAPTVTVPTTANLLVANLSTRQETVPGCFSDCIAVGNTTGCAADPTDFSCLCGDMPFLQSVVDCLYDSCRTVEQVNTSITLAGTTCAQYGITIPDVQDSQPTGSSAMYPYETVLTVPHTVRTSVATKIDIIMGTICGAMLALALGIGFYGCFRRNKQNKEEASRSQWATQTGSVTSPTFNPTKSYNAFDIPANMDQTRSFGGSAAHQTRSVGRVAVPGLGMRDLTHLDPRDVRMPNALPRSAFGRVAFRDKDADLFEDDEELDTDDDVRVPFGDELDDGDQIVGLQDRAGRKFVSNRANSIHSLDTTEDKEDHSPTDSTTRFVSTLSRGDGTPGTATTSSSEGKHDEESWGNATIK